MALNNPYSRSKPLQRAVAEAAVTGYCHDHNLSLEKLKTQRFETVADMMIFAQPTGVSPDGLRNDLATRPIPTLVIRLDDNGKLSVEGTPHTERYLSNQA